MPWAHSHHAPRDRFVWLFLPCSKYDMDAKGVPSNIRHECVQAKWNDQAKAWVTKEGRHVYPSLWSDAPLDGVMPDNPLLELT